MTIKPFYDLLPFEGGDIFARFFGNRTTAMMAQYANNVFNLAMKPKNQDVNWDVAAFPMFTKKLDTRPQAAAPSFYISKTAKNKDLAFQTAVYMLSDEIQREMKPVNQRF